MKRIGRLAAAALLLAVVAACSGGGATATPGAPTTGGPSAAPPDPASPTLRPPSGVAVPIKSAPEAPRACMDALLTGILAPSPVSGIGVADPNGQVMPVEWPFGYTGMLAEGKLVLLDEAGRLVAKVGDEINVGGGFGTQFWHACAPVTVTKPG